MPDSPICSVRRKQDIGSLLSEQLQKHVGPECQILLGQEKLWASVTFSGTRYRFTVTGTGPNAILQPRMDQLADHEFELPGYFVADVLVRQSDTENATFELDILAIADPVSE